MKRVILLCICLAAVTRVSALSGYVVAGHLRIYYEVRGSGDPLLFLHAGGLDGRMWEEQAAYFSDRYRVITIDQPGHGKSEGIDTVIQQQEVVRVVLDSLHIERLTLIGSSLGAVCATDFALAYPGRVNKLVLISPGLNGWWELFTADSLSGRLFREQERIDSLRDPVLNAQKSVEMWCIGPFRPAAAVSPVIREYAYQAMLSNVHYEEGWGPVWNRHRSARRLKEIKCPVLIVTGDLDIPFILRVADFIQSNVPQSVRVRLPGVAHMLNMEAPDRLNEVVTSFMK